MKTINELKEITRKFFTDNGLIEEKTFLNVETTYFTKEKCEVKRPKYIDYKGNECSGLEVEGRILEVTELYRSNGTSENASIEIAIVEYHKKSGRRIFREKMYVRNGDKKINAILASAVAAYKN